MKASAHLMLVSRWTSSGYNSITVAAVSIRKFSHTIIVLRDKPRIVGVFNSAKGDEFSSAL